MSLRILKTFGYSYKTNLDIHTRLKKSELTLEKKVEPLIISNLFSLNRRAIFIKLKF